MATLTLSATVRPALAQTPDRLVDPDVAAFSSQELAQALLARSFPAEDLRPPRVRITSAGRDAVTVQAAGQSRLVALGAQTGSAAARVVALVIADLMSSAGEIAPTEDADATESAAPAEDAAAPLPPVVTVTEVSKPPTTALASAAPTTSGPTAPLRLYVTGGVAKGTGTEELAAATLDADVSVALGPRLRLAPSAGLVYMPTRNRGAWNEVSFSSAIGRLLGGGSWGPVDLLGGPFVAAYRIGGATPHEGILFGAEALVRVAAPLSGRARLVVATRGHAYGNRVRAVWLNDTGFATPRLELTIGVGLAWDWAS